MIPVDEAEVFQPPLPAGGETVLHHIIRFFNRNFNPLSPQGERRMSDVRRSVQTIFQPPLPAGGETPQTPSHLCQKTISTPSPRRGRDVYRVSIQDKRYYISTPSPRRGRDRKSFHSIPCQTIHFQQRMPLCNPFPLSVHEEFPKKAPVFRCEPLGDGMSAWGSHYSSRTSSGR